MPNGPSSPFHKDDWLTLAGLFGFFGAAAWWVGARADVPVIDDWVYAWSVEHFVHTGRLRVLDFSAIYPIAQIVWGALVARIAGFSFGALRCSTVVLAVFGCWAVYLTLREMGCRWSTSALGAFAIALDPVYFALSFSFMTDVPFVSLASIATYCYVTAVRRDSAARLWMAGGWTVLAFLVRPLAVVLPFSVVPALLWRSDWRAALRRATPPLVTTAIGMVLLQSQLARVFGPLDGAAVREGWLADWFSIPFGYYAKWSVEVLLQSALPLAPLLLATLIRWRRALLVAVLGLFLIPTFHLMFGALPSAFPDWQTWSFQDIGARALIGGDLDPSPWSVRAKPVAQVVGLLVTGALLAACLRRGATRWGRGELVAATLTLLHVGMIHVLWLYNDRYYLVLAPPLVMLAARALDTDRSAQLVAAAGLIVWAAIALTGTRDMLAFNDAAALAVRQLEATGVPAWEIDAGYSLNGWRLYAHPEQLPPEWDRRDDVPFVTSDRPTQYAITNRPLAGFDIARVVPLRSASWQTTNAIYVLRRHMAAPGEP